MYLHRVQITNFRSIEEIVIEFDPKCRTLVGINESGKTNILDALNLLDPDVAITRRDLREPGLNEDKISNAHVWFAFRFSPEETKTIIESSKALILSRSHNSQIVEIDGTKYKLAEFCKSREALYVANIITRKKYVSSWTLSDARILGKWKKVSSSCPATLGVDSDGKGGIIPLNRFKLVDTSEFSSIPDEYLEEASAEDLNEVVSSFTKKRVKEALPKVLFWDYDEENLLPSRIPLQAFCEDPDSCIPLKRMFQLYDIYNIQQEIDSAKEGGANSLNNLLRKVAARTSKHFHDTWKEYDGIKFSLVVDGPDLVAGIEDKSNRYELSQRSDGFKRFVTFLLMVSAEDVADQLKDTLILIDEPEIGLHPTGARYLMEELIKIARNNYVVFSTHSIFMIDGKKIERHFIVTKKNEITTVETVTESNIKDEEVIFKSLGYSIFASLKEKNVIFEGWKDKKLFETAITRVPAEHDAVKQLKMVGRCFAQGVKQIRNITPLFEAGDRKCLIVSDNDAVAKEQQKIYRESKGYGAWKRYDEILHLPNVVTGEDFIKASAFRSSMEETGDTLQISPLSQSDLESPRGKIYALKQWLSSAGVDPEKAAKAIEMIKNAVFEDLKHSDILPAYFEYLTGVAKIIEKI